MEHLSAIRLPLADLGEIFIKANLPVVIYGMNVLGNDVSDPVILLYAGDTDEGTLVIEETTTAGVATTISYPTGIIFPNGCFVDSADTNISQVTIFYKYL